VEVDTSKGSKPRYLVRITPSKHHESLFIKTKTGQIQKKDSHAAASTTIPIAHQIYKTFPECKKFYKRLFQLTNCTDYDMFNDYEMCTCAQGTCPLWTLNHFFRTYYLPSGGLGLTQRSIQKALAQRMPIVNKLFNTVMQHVKLAAAQQDAVETKECEVIRFLCTFLQLNREVLGRFDQAMRESKSSARLNLQGWQLHRQTRFTHDDNTNTNTIPDATFAGAMTTATVPEPVTAPKPEKDIPHPLAPLRPILHGLNGLQLSDAPEQQTTED
jgi:hypothetical protein